MAAALSLLPAFLPAPARSAPSCQPVPHLDRLSTIDGLSHNAVFAVLQDRSGFLWIGTQDGLDRWDGLELVSTQLPRAASSPLGGALVTALSEDTRRRLWIGTAAGLYRLEADRRSVAVIPLPVERPAVRALATDGEQLWVATDRAVTLIRADGSPQLVSSAAGPHETILDLVADRDGALWLLRADPLSASLVQLPKGGEARALTLSHKRQNLAPATSGGVWIDAGLPPVRADAPPPVLAAGRPPSALLEDRRGTLWIGSHRGLYLRRRDQPLCRAARDPSAPHRLTDEINTLYEDQEGAIWIGTYGGLLRWDPHRKPFEHLPATDPPGVPALEVGGEPISSVAIAVGRELWAGTFGNGLLRVDPHTGYRTESWRRREDGCGDYIWDLELDASGGLWIASSEGLCRLEPGARRRAALGGGEIRDLELDRDGILWLATERGLARLEPGSPRVRPVGNPGDPEIILDTVAVAPDGTVWGGAGLDGGGHLLRLRPGSTVETFRALVPEGIWDLHPDRDGTLWMATGAGLRQLEAAAEGVRVRAPTGLPAVVAYSLQEDASGQFWAGTSRGLLRFDPAQPEEARLLDLADGAGSLEFNRHAVARSGDRLFFGGMQGITHFDPAEFREMTTPPPVALTALRILGEAGERDVSPFALSAVELEPADTTLEIDFVALVFTQTGKNRYRYRLEGYDPAWVEAGARRFARYTALAPGSYTFRATAANADGVWNEAGATLAVVVHPAFWQTAWFRALLAAALLAALYAWHRYRLRNLLELERLRLRIASDLHDDLSSDLSAVAVAAESVARQESLTDVERRRLKQVRDTALRLVEGVREIVWAIDPEHDNLEATVRRMRHACEQMLADTEWTFEVSADVRRGEIGMARRRDLLLVLKEALNNVARHAAAERVEVRLEDGRGSLSLTIVDDGVGFDPASVEVGRGLASLRRRAESAGGAIDIVSAPGGGTRLTLRIPKTRDGGSRRDPLTSPPNRET